MSASLMQPLRDEHAELLPHIDGVCAAADAVGSESLERLRTLVDRTFEFLVHHLIPHATAEDRVLYPAVQRAMGAPEATATMSRDHVEIDRLTHELGDLRAQLRETTALSEELARSLRRVLYGLFVLVKVHFAKEEEVYLPLLEARLNPEEAADLFEAMEAAAEAAHDH